MTLKRSAARHTSTPGVDQFAPADRHRPRLTGRQQTILTLICDGFSDAEIVGRIAPPEPGAESGAERQGGEREDNGRGAAASEASDADKEQCG